MRHPKPKSPDRESRTDETPDWWSLAELGVRWKVSVATLRRRTRLPADDPQHLRTMAAGAAALRVHIDEILRHEAGAKGVVLERKQEVIVKPRITKVRSILEKKMQSLREAKKKRDMQAA